MEQEPPIALKRKIKIWRVKILTTTWLSYAGFYFCRKNYASVKDSILTSMHITNFELAHIFSAYLTAYMLGQFVTGLLGMKLAARILLLAGMAVTLVCNVLFGFTYLMGPAGYYPMIFFMVVNGFAQATGWPGNVGVLSNWLARRERGKIMAVWATCYQLGSALAKAFAGFMLGWLGVVWSFWGASVVMLGVWIIFLIFQRDNPEDVGLPTLVKEIEIEVPIDQSKGAAAEAPPTSGLGWTRDATMTIIFMGSVYFVFKFLRYALDSWTPMAAIELFGTDKDTASYISSIFDWIGFLGVLFGGWITDRYFDGRRHQTILLMTLGMFGAFSFLNLVGLNSLLMFGIGLAVCGFMLMGPDSLLSGVGAIDVGGRRGAILAAGIINGLGSIGPIFQEELIGWTLDEYGFHTSFDIMLAVSFLGVIGTLYISLRSWRGKSNL